MGRLVQPLAVAVRVLLWGWAVLVIVAAAAWATGRLVAALPLTGLVGASAAALLVAPALLFLTYALRHPPAEIPRELRRAATESGISLLVVGALLALTVNALDMGALFVGPSAAVAVLGVIVIARVLTLAPPGPSSSGVLRLYHRGATIAGAVTLLLFVMLAPRVLGEGSQPGRPTEANMRSDLRTLVASQDAFQASHHRYGSLADLSAGERPYRPDFSLAEITVVVESTRFVATATSPKTRLICVVWSGTPVPPADSVHGAEDGVPACWQR